jgi:hypothetical protein
LDILKKAERDFKPELLLMMSGPGGIVTNLAMVKSGRFYPIYTAMLENKKIPTFSFAPKGYTKISTKKWNIYLPDVIFEESSKRILIIDDCVMSGDVQSTVRNFFSDKGISETNFMFASLVCSKIAQPASKAPEIYGYLNPHGEFYFPWGEWH